MFSSKFSRKVNLRLCILLWVTFICTSFQSTSKSYPISQEQAFINGEELKYDLHYGFISGGEAVISLKKELLNGTEVYHASAKAKTTGIVDKIFKVIDIYESFFEPTSNLPLKTIRNIHEGNYKQYNEVLFNNQNNTVLSSTGEHPVPDNILDMVSSLFYIRRIDFSNMKIGEIISINTYFGDEVFPFYIIFKGREVVKTSLGKFKCLKFVPVVEPGRIFKKKDDMTFWLSDDANKVPISIRFDILVGSFKCDLASYRNNKYIMSSRVN